MSSSAIPSSKRLGYGTTLAFFGRELDELSRRKSGHANCSPKRRRKGGGKEEGVEVSAEHSGAITRGVL